MSFDNWYWSYGYGSKLACIKMVEQSDLPEEEKKIRIQYHLNNLGKYSPEISGELFSRCTSSAASDPPDPCCTP